MDKVWHFVLMIFLLVLSGSCIRDKDSECISEEYMVRVFIEDKNYWNVDAVDPDDKMDETMPFGRFIETLHYTLQDVATGAMVREAELVSKTDMGDDYEIGLRDIPYGRYKLTVWGNVISDLPLGVLHKDNMEEPDLYLASSTVDVSSAFQTTDIMLDRVKGMLLVRLTNFPSYISTVNSNITNVFESVNADFVYVGNASVLKETSLQEEIKATLAPSVAEGASKLKLELFTNNTTVTRADPAVTLPEIDLTIRRNEITVISVDYNIAVGKWEIWTYIDGRWTKIHSLDIEELFY